ncbi:MAG TPA: SRPBCC family protein [Chloroflexota bacterium]|nr:SRPBCC family protein [Chloroflexota bacterium]
MQTSAMERAAPEAALAVEERVKVPAPVAEVYQRWTDFSRYPEFVEHIQEVRPVGGGRYHWSGRLLGITQEWETEVVDQQENQRLAWRSLDGTRQYGAVTFEPLPNNQTQVNLRMEYTPPEGMGSRELDQLTHSTRRSVKRSLKHFAALVRGERTPEGMGAISPGIQPMATALALPVGAGIAGGIAAAVLLQRRARQANRFVLRRRPLDLLERRGALTGWLLTMAGVANVIVAVNFRRRGDPTKALTASQYAPTLLGVGILAHLLGQRTWKPRLPGAIASWAFTSAAAGALVSSTLAHLRGRGGEGLFLGQWTPLFLTAALVSRLFSHK